MNYQDAIDHIKSVYGDSIGTGRLRIVFRDNDTVIKVPMNESGHYGNLYEASTWQSPEPRAKCWIDEELTAECGVAILRMEHVIHVGWSEKADWTWSVDCGQVGMTADGRKVAYDWERER